MIIEKGEIIKICVYCGEPFVRRKNETKDAFRKRKKCMAGCVAFTDKATKVAGFYAHPAEETGDCGIKECHMFTRSWFTQHRHWSKHY